MSGAGPADLSEQPWNRQPRSGLPPPADDARGHRRNGRVGPSYVAPNVEAQRRKAWGAAKTRPITQPTAPSFTAGADSAQVENLCYRETWATRRRAAPSRPYDQLVVADGGLPRRIDRTRTLPPAHGEIE